LNLIDHFADVFALYSIVRQNAHDKSMTFDVVAEKFRTMIGKARESCIRFGYSDRDIGYSSLAVCAWVDEKILGPDLEWSEKQKWLHSTLQKEHCGTSRAGEVFFDRLALINKQRDLPESQKDYNEKELREVFDYCLSMGFKGKYTTPEDEHLLNNVIAENRQYLGSAESVSTDRLFPEAYKEVTTTAPNIFSKYSKLFLAIPAILLLIIYLFYLLDLNGLYHKYF
jgi:type VI secretion system protein ImpK